MKNLLTLTIICCSMSFTFAQEVEKHLAEAKSAYAQKELENTRYALQQSLQELDVAISKEILGILPTSLENLESDPETDQYMGSSMGYVGVFVNRNYGKPSEMPNVEIDLMNDSPFLAAVSAYLSNPMISMATEGQKSVKIDGYKSVLQIQEDENGTLTGYSLQIPFGNSLLTMNANGITDENTVIRMGNSLNIRQIAALVE